MKAPFVYGRIASDENFTNREKESKLLKQNFINLVNTILISPRRWGKTSLVNHVIENLKRSNEDIIVCQIDIFNCRTEEQFYKVYANSIIKATTTAWEEFLSSTKKYLGKLMPIVSLTDNTNDFEFSFGIDFRDAQFSVDEILDLPQKIAHEKNKKIVICIDEFQNVNDYDDSLGFQRKLRAHWQRHDSVAYCLYGSKRHMLLNIFNDYEMPFYKFGDILFLKKIDREEWIEFITSRFKETGKSITPEEAAQIADIMKNHPYYTQQLSQQVWLRTQSECNMEMIHSTFLLLIDQLSLLFTNIIDSLTPKQINFLIAISRGESNFSSKEILQKYQLGTSANIKNLKKATLEKDIIDFDDQNRIILQDPTFEYWIKNIYTKGLKL